MHQITVNGFVVDVVRKNIKNLHLGTCNIKARRIWLNLELIKKPIHCLEYIIVHEMVHLLERHHNDRFMAYMNNFMPLWHYYREELNREPLGHESWGY